jgi:hypothetical protein
MISTIEPTTQTRSEAPRRNPTMSQRIWNLATAVASFMSDGCRTVKKEQYHVRLAICDSCPERRDNICIACGCQLSLKAQARALDCPVGKWPVLTADTSHSDLPPPS